jgi:cold shock CspA family protein
MRLRGKLTKWKDDRGFGFITPIRGGRQVFVHIKAFTNQHRRPIGNEFVTYETVCDDTGRLRAEHVEFMGDDSINAAAGWTIALTIALLFLIFVGVSVFIGQLPLMSLHSTWLSVLSRSLSTVTTSQRRCRISGERARAH